MPCRQQQTSKRTISTLIFPTCGKANFAPPPLADPDDPHKLIRTRLSRPDRKPHEQKQIWKSSSSCRVAFVMRLHRRAVLQEIWCASFEEYQVYLSIAGHPEVVNFMKLSYSPSRGQDLG